MLKTVWLNEQPNMKQGVAMLLGGFDGLHAGHRKLLEKAKENGSLVGLMTIIGGKNGESLFTNPERELIFKEAGADFVFELPFAEIKNLSPLEFLQMLEREFSPNMFVCGEDFRFGLQAKGTPNFIKEYTQVRVEVLPLVEINGEKVSATRVKRLLSEGRVEEVKQCLTHDFFLIGEVFADRKIGRIIGFPTANILYPKGKYPLKKGVYETRTVVNGKAYKGITNYGARPTFDDETVLTETYLDGFSGDLYGKSLKVEFVRFLREIKKFDSAEALKKQLNEDIARVRNHD